MSHSATPPPAELLERIARSLKTEIGPAVTAAYPKTQAFMASVVLQKLARELRTGDTHDAQNRADAQRLARDLERALADVERPPAAVARATRELGKDPGAPALTALVEALYAGRRELGESRFEMLLSRVRTVLRARIDRALEVSA